MRCQCFVPAAVGFRSWNTRRNVSLINSWNFWSYRTISINRFPAVKDVSIFIFNFQTPGGGRNGPGGGEVLSTRFMVAIKSYLYMWTAMFQLCLQMSRQIISGNWSLPLSSLQTWKVAKYNLNFLSSPRSHPLPLTFSKILTPDGRCGLELYFVFFFFYLASRDISPRWGVWISDEQGVQQLPSLLLWHWGLGARPSKCWRHPHLCALQRVGRREGRGRGEEGWGRVKWLVYRPPSPWHIMKIKVPEA